jgi:hypothetical protein
MNEKEDDDMVDLGYDRWTSVATCHAMLARFPDHQDGGFYKIKKYGAKNLFWP